MSEDFRSDPMADALAALAIEHHLEGCVLVAVPRGTDVARFAIAGISPAHLANFAGLARGIAQAMKDGDLTLEPVKIAAALVAASKFRTN